uniref:Uncharacterized protein n=1 Tax=uncultured Nocardioidaceae bacterium TaxID=253824 RepID=A0A6J4KRA6_9ACTN|nr:MAG: hypothetical protein AVDCRST_MAG46-304 [uncultured Nocardioidaceae bacterium]
MTAVTIPRSELRALVVRPVSDGARSDSSTASRASSSPATAS